METQSTQNGLTQLFMSLGLSTANPLNNLEGSDSADGAAFNSLLASYLPQSTFSPISDADQATASVLGPVLEEPLVDLLPVSEETLNGGAEFDLKNGEAAILPVDVESLPLSDDPLGKTLPLVPQTIQPSQNDLALKANKKSEQDPSASINGEGHALKGDHEVQSLLENQGFYAQSLVSSLIPAKPVSNSSMNMTTLSRKEALGTEGVTAASLNVLANKNVSNISLSSGLDSTSLELSEESSGELSEDVLRPIAPSFLKNNKAVTQLDSPIVQTPTTLTNNVTIEQTSILNTALAMNEDPTDLSLQELSDIEDLEKADIEQKLSTTERKQDEQTLKLSKGQQAWGDALAGKISMNAAKNVQQVTIHLDPPELGSLELKLNVKDDQQTQVQVQVQSPQVKEALESSANRLRDMLAEQGLELSEFDVQTGSQQGGDNDQQAAEEGLSSNQQDSDALSLEEESTIQIPARKNNNLLDTFV